MARRNCDYLWSHHLPIAGRAGLTTEDVEAIRCGRCADPIDQLIVQAVDDLLDDGTISDATWNQLGQTFSDEQRMDLVFTIGGYLLARLGRQHLRRPKRKDPRVTDEPSGEAELFIATTRAFLDKHASLTDVRALHAQDRSYDPAWWRHAAELGWTSLLVPEQYGGASISGKPLRDVAAIAEQLGRTVAPGPLHPVSTVLDRIGRRRQPR